MGSKRRRIATNGGGRVNRRFRLTKEDVGQSGTPKSKVEKTRRLLRPRGRNVSEKGFGAINLILTWEHHECAPMPSVARAVNQVLPVFSGFIKCRAHLRRLAEGTNRGNVF